MLARVNNVEKDSQIRKWNKWTNSKEWYTETHTGIDKWGRATKEWAQNVEFTENARVAQLKRDASTIAQQADTTLVHNYDMQNVWAFYPKYAMYGSRCFSHDDPRWSIW